MKLQNGHRYTFYLKEEFEKISSNFRANFIDVIDTTLRVEKYCRIDANQIETGMHTIPLSWIEKAESLVDYNIIDLNRDILFEIDNFVQ
jgi:hypothetical protein